MQSKLTKTIQEKLERLKRYGTEPDHELLLWEDWVRIRKEDVIELGKKTMRAPADLTLHLVDEFRDTKEQRTLLEHAQLRKRDGPRGGKWNLDPLLRRKDVTSPQVKPTRAEIGRPPIIDHVGVPEYIQIHEKGKIGKQTRKRHVHADYMEYRDKREAELKERIDKINPVRPEMKELIVLGTKPKPPAEIVKLILPKITFTDSVDSCLDPLQEVYALRINNTVIFKEQPERPLVHLRKLQQESWHEQCYSWTYYFNVPIERMGRAKLHLENLGTVALRYCWKKIRRTIPFIPEDIYEQTFFFYKSEDVISPGQSKDILFTFISNRPGTFSESWELSLLNVCLFDSLADTFIINLSGDSVEKMKAITRKIEKLESRIDRKAITGIIISLINEVCTKATMIQPEIYSYKNKLLEMELFVMKNPICFYHQTEVLALKEKYEKELVPGQKWDLSIGSWRAAMMKKEFDERMMYYEFLKNSHSVLLKPWYEGDSLLTEKYRAVNTVLGQLANKFFDEKMRLLVWNGVMKPSGGAGSGAGDTVVIESPLIPNPLSKVTVDNVFYLHMYDHVASAMEICAGLLSSLDLNRMLEFDFCRY